MRHHDLQFDFPRYELPEIPSWLLTVHHWIGKLTPALSYLFWGICGLCLAALLFYIGRLLWRHWRAMKPAVQDMRTAMEAWRPTAAQAHALLSDADALAQQGQFGEAVHLLLLRSIEDLESFRPRHVKRADTAREIEQLGIMPMRVRAAFAGIMGLVERSLFGGMALAEADYRQSRSDYERFAFPDAWRSG